MTELQNAYGAGYFDEVDRLLKCRDRQVSEAAGKTKYARAEIALLQSKIDHAYELFLCAAECFRSVDLDEMRKRKESYASDLAQYGERYKNPRAFELAAKMRKESSDGQSN